MPLLAIALLLLGIVGLIVPILPGLPLLVAAALLFAANAPGLRRRILRAPRIERMGSRLGRPFHTPAADGLTAWQRAKLRMLTGLARVLPKRRRS